MLRRTFAVALLCVTLLFCGLDTSAVGHPAEGETALHALTHRDDVGTSAAVAQLAAAAFVALGAIALLTFSQASLVLRRTPDELAAELTTGWRTPGITRGPPARA
jgi:hypothetical protein